MTAVPRPWLILALALAALVVAVGFYIRFPYSGAWLGGGILFVGVFSQWPKIASYLQKNIKGWNTLVVVASLVLYLAAALGFVAAEMPRNAAYQLSVHCEDAKALLPGKKTLELKLQSLHQIWVKLGNTQVTIPFVDLAFQDDPAAKADKSAAATILGSGPLTIAPLPNPPNDKDPSVFLVLTLRTPAPVGLRFQADADATLRWSTSIGNWLSLHTDPGEVKTIMFKLDDEFDLLVRNAQIECGKHKETLDKPNQAGKYRLRLRDNTQWVMLHTGQRLQTAPTFELRFELQKEATSYLTYVSGAISRFDIPTAGNGKLAVSQQDLLDFDKAYIVGAKVAAPGITEVVALELHKNGLQIRCKGHTTDVSVEDENQIGSYLEIYHKLPLIALIVALLIWWIDKWLDTVGKSDSSPQTNPPEQGQPPQQVQAEGVAPPASAQGRVSS